MENVKRGKEEEERMGLPPGFRFHPTDEELITHYLSKKAVDEGFTSTAITEVDLNKSEPWELPWKAKMGEKEWYFFCVRDRKYPTGLRTNRATKAGYWKATGKDKQIFKGRVVIVGMKKTLVFYEGRAPRGLKTSWVMHEFRLHGHFSFPGFPPSPPPPPPHVQNEWVICRVFQKSSSGKKVHVSGMMKTTSTTAITATTAVAVDQISGIHPLPFRGDGGTQSPGSENPQFMSSSSIDEARGSQSDSGFSYSFSSMQCNPVVQPAMGNWQLHGWLQEQTYLKSVNMMMDNQLQASLDINNEISTTTVVSDIAEMERRRGFAGGGGPSSCLDIDCLWNY